jgi:hypothetical protein
MDTPQHLLNTAIQPVIKQPINQHLQSSAHHCMLPLFHRSLSITNTLLLYSLTGRSSLMASSTCERTHARGTQRQIDKKQQQYQKHLDDQAALLATPAEATVAVVGGIAET